MTTTQLRQSVLAFIHANSCSQLNPGGPFPSLPPLPGWHGTCPPILMEHFAQAMTQIFFFYVLAAT